MGYDYHLTIGDGSTTTPTWPGADNTGAVGALTAIYGNQTPAAGATLENLDIYGRVFIKAAGITIRNCRVRGDNIGGTAGVGSQSLIDARDRNCATLLIEDCTLAPDYPSVWWTGVHGHDFTATGCNIYNVVDGFGIYNTNATSALANVTITGNWVHDLHCWFPDYDHTNGTHNDCVQIMGNGGVTITANTFSSSRGLTSGGTLTVYGLSCLMVTPDVSACPAVVFTGNKVDWGIATINVGPKDKGTSTSVTIANNRFGRNRTADTSGNTFDILVYAGTTVPGLRTTTGPDTSGNVFDDTGTPVTVTRF